MNINKKTYKILNLIIVVLFLVFLFIYSASINKKDNRPTIKKEKTFLIQKTVAGYLLEIEGLFFELREKKKIEYFKGVSNPLTAFEPLKKDVWLDYILSAIQNNYNNREECYFPPTTNVNKVNIYKIRNGDQTEISPSIKININYTNELQKKIDSCFAFMNELIDEVNGKIRQLVINEIRGHEYHSFIKNLKKRNLNDLISGTEDGGNISSSDMIAIAQTLVLDEINLKKKAYEDINSFELKAIPTETRSSFINHYIPVLFAIIITIFLIFILYIGYRSKKHIPNIFK